MNFATDDVIRGAILLTYFCVFARNQQEMNVRNQCQKIDSKIQGGPALILSFCVDFLTFFLYKTGHISYLGNVKLIKPPALTSDFVKERDIFTVNLGSK